MTLSCVLFRQHYPPPSAEWSSPPFSLARDQNIAYRQSESLTGP
jgi:hypothetical protein